MKTSNLQPLSNLVIIRRDKPPEETPGGILLPDSAKKPLNRGKVIAVGPGKRTDHGELIAAGVKAGQVVLFPRHSGHDLHHDGEDLLILHGEDLLAVVEDESCGSSARA